MRLMSFTCICPIKLLQWSLLNLGFAFINKVHLTRGYGATAKRSTFKQHVPTNSGSLFIELKRTKGWVDLITLSGFEHSTIGLLFREWSFIVQEELVSGGRVYFLKEDIYFVYNRVTDQFSTQIHKYFLPLSKANFHSHQYQINRTQSRCNLMESKIENNTTYLVGDITRRLNSETKVRTKNNNKTANIPMTRHYPCRHLLV